MKRLFILAIFIAAAASMSYAQTSRLGGLPDRVGKSHPMQSFAIDRDTVFVCYDAGNCKAFSLKDMALCGEFKLGCHIPSNHCGNANFGIERAFPSSAHPVLYVSGDLANKCCYVQDITAGGAVTVQTISFDLDNEYGGSQAVIDTLRRKIVYMQRRERDIARQDNSFMVYEFPLPLLSEGDVTFHDEDAMCRYELSDYFPIYQGACIRNGKLLLSYGYPGKETGVATYSLETHLLVGRAILDYGFEPQAVCAYNDDLYINFIGGGLHRFNHDSDPLLHVAAYIWPSCHRDSLAEAHLWKEGQGEWEVIRKGDPRFEGHLQPKRPLWGYEMDDDPRVVEKWIRTALKYGVDTFVYDWYWYKGGPFLESALDKGFLGALSNGKMNFYIMWANHDVKYSYWNYHLHGANNDDILFSADVTEEDWHTIVDRIISRYFTRLNYMKIDGCPVFALYSPANFIRSFGGSMTKAREALDYFRRQTVLAGFPGLHIQEVNGEGKMHNEERFSQKFRRAHALGMDSEAFYNMGGFNTDYGKHCARALDIRARWEEVFDIPVFPCVSIGWDDTPRFPGKGRKDVTTSGNTPAAFGAALAKAVQYSEEHPEPAKIVYINAWNEWVEGSYLLPDKENRFGYLKAVKKIVK